MVTILSDIAVTAPKYCVYFADRGRFTLRFP
jgi:hypothetical protein